MSDDAHAPRVASVSPSYPRPARYPGRLIVVEGIDGSGKSTQLRLLMQWLQARGHPVYLTAWNSSTLVHRTLKRAKRNMALTPTTFSLLHAADLAVRLERDILPRLRAGQVVLADRWVPTAFARDQARSLDAQWLRQAYAFAPKPHLAVYFRVPVDEAVSRILAGRHRLRYYEAGSDLQLDPDPQVSFRMFQRRVQLHYEAMVQAGELAVLDGLAPVAVQQAELRHLLEDILKRQPRTSGVALPRP